MPEKLEGVELGRARTACYGPVLPSPPLLGATAMKTSEMRIPHARHTTAEPAGAR